MTINRDIAEYSLEKSIANGADQARIIYKEGVSSNFSLLNRELDSIQESSSSSIIIQIFKDSKYGEFSSNLLHKESLNSFIKDAVSSVKMLSPDHARSLPLGDRYYHGKEKDSGIALGQYDTSYHEISASQKKELLFNLQEIQSENTLHKFISLDESYEDSYDHVLMLDSQGFEGSSRMSYYSICSECTVEGKNSYKPQGYWQESNIFFNKLENNSTKIAYDRAIAMLNPKKIKTGNYPVIVESHIAFKLLSPIISALNGASIQQRNSFLLNSLEKEIFTPKFTLTDKPHTKGALLSRFFDSEGVATSEMDIIKDGVISNYFINTYYSNKLGMKATVDNISVPYLKPLGEIDKASMINTLNKGILITGFNGGNSNSITGDFSYGIEGFYIENGIILHPIKEVNITGNFINLWNNILHIGEDIRQNSIWRMPTLCFDAVSISGL